MAERLTNMSFVAAHRPLLGSPALYLSAAAALALGCFATPVLRAQSAPLPAASTVASTGAAAKDAKEDGGKVTTLNLGANLVNLPVVVRDKNGALVQNLTKDDFTLQVDGKPQPIRYFDQDRDLPLTLGLLVDTSQSQRGVLDDERTASGTFLDSMLKGRQDRAFVIQFAHQAELLADLTDSRPKLQAALKDIDSDDSGGGGSNDSNGGGGRSRGGTVLYDATFLGSDELMGKQKGRKAIILLTDGDDRGSKESITRAIEAAQRSDTILYAIYFHGEERGGYGNNGGGYPGGGRRGGGGYPGGGYPGGGGGYPGGGGGNGGGRGGNNGGGSRVDGKKILERMTSETGGRMFEVTKKQTVANIYTQIGEELRAQYRLGYTPDTDHAAEGYHQVDLALKDTKSKDRIQTRDGYYTGTAQP